MALMMLLHSSLRQLRRDPAVCKTRIDSARRQFQIYIYTLLPSSPPPPPDHAMWEHKKFRSTQTSAVCGIIFACADILLGCFYDATSTSLRISSSNAFLAYIYKFSCAFFHSPSCCSITFMVYKCDSFFSDCCCFIFPPNTGQWKYDDGGGAQLRIVSCT